MKTKAYTLLGWMSWQGIKTVSRRKLGQNKGKLGALLTVALVLVAGLLAGKAAIDDDS